MIKLKNLVLDTTNAALLAVENWDCENDTVEFWRGSSNYVYRFYSNGRRHFLRLSHEEENSLEKISAEMDYLQYLGENNYPCNQLIMSKSGNFIEIVDTPEGKFYCVVFAGVEGENLDVKEMTIEQIEAWGSSLAKLHILSSKYDNGKVKRRNWKDILEFVKITLDQFPEEKTAMEELKRIEKWLDSLCISQENYGLIHYDFEVDNIFWNKELNSFSVIDFDDSMYHWYVMDIVIALENIIDEGELNITNKSHAFLNGYRKIKAINEKLFQEKSRFMRFDNLYTFARDMRALQDQNIKNEPSWLEHVRTKLINGCHRIRKGFEQQW